MDDDQAEKLIELALREDLGQQGDITAQALIDPEKHASMILRSRAEGILSGSLIATKTMQTVDNSIEVIWKMNNGDTCIAGDSLALINGPLISILTSERTTLNFLQHLSGIATLTRKYVDELARIGSRTIVRDTRKTLPGYRALEKQAVVDGGGENHRMGLYDAFLVKDNHLVGTDLESVVNRCREYNSEVPLEVEVDDLEQLRLVREYKPDLVLLDNFSVEEVLAAQEIAPEMVFEISGGITLDNLAAYGATNVQYIAVGAITHSAPALDLGFDAL